MLLLAQQLPKQYHVQGAPQGCTYLIYGGILYLTME